MTDERDGGAVPALRSKRDVSEQLERLAIPADAKALLAQLAETTVRAGDYVLQAGRRILQFALECVKLFPATTFGVIVGATLSMLVGSVPVLGAVLGPLVGPLLVALGLGVGALVDVLDAGFSDRLRRLADEFQAALDA
jgi:hypothetical protein